MRSRNGTGAIACTVYALILFVPLGAQNYHIGYRCAVKDALLLNESLHISRAMTPCKGTIVDTLLIPKEGKSLQALLEQSEDFFALLQRHNLHVNSRDLVHNAHASSLTTLTFPTQCFEVEFNNDFARIALIK